MNGAPKCRLGKEIARKESALPSSPSKQQCSIAMRTASRGNRTAKRRESRALLYSAPKKKNPPGRNKTEMQARNASTNAVGEKNLATKIRRENFAPHSTIVVAREGFGEENRKKKKPGDRGEANLRRQNHEARFQPRTKEQQKKNPSSTSLRDGSRVRRAG